MGSLLWGMETPAIGDVPRHAPPSFWWRGMKGSTRTSVFGCWGNLSSHGKRRDVIFLNSTGNSAGEPERSLCTALAGGGQEPSILGARQVPEPSIIIPWNTIDVFEGFQVVIQLLTGPQSRKLRINSKLKQPLRGRTPLLEADRTPNSYSFTTRETLYELHLAKGR
jgi:hypothetical protein